MIRICLAHGIMMLYGELEYNFRFSTIHVALFPFLLYGREKNECTMFVDCVKKKESVCMNAWNMNGRILRKFFFLRENTSLSEQSADSTADWFGLNVAWMEENLSRRDGGRKKRVSVAYLLSSWLWLKSSVNKYSYSDTC